MLRQSLHESSMTYSTVTGAAKTRRTHDTLTLPGMRSRSPSLAPGDGLADLFKVERFAHDFNGLRRPDEFLQSFLVRRRNHEPAAPHCLGIAHQLQEIPVLLVG